MAAVPFICVFSPSFSCPHYSSNCLLCARPLVPAYSAPDLHPAPDLAPPVIGYRSCLTLYSLIFFPPDCALLEYAGNPARFLDVSLPC